MDEFDSGVRANIDGTTLAFAAVFKALLITHPTLKEDALRQINKMHGEGRHAEETPEEYNLRFARALQIIMAVEPPKTAP